MKRIAKCRIYKNYISLIAKNMCSKRSSAFFASLSFLDQFRKNEKKLDKLRAENETTRRSHNILQF